MITDVEEGRFVVAEADSVADMLAPVGEEALRLEVPEHGAVDVGTGDTGPQRGNATCCAATVWSNSRRITSVGAPMIIARSSSAL